MTSIAHPLSARAKARSEEKTATFSTIGCAGMLPALILRGVGLGFVGLAVILTVAATLIGVHEIQQEEASSALPTQIRYN
jgi:hypothetical protein